MFVAVLGLGGCTKSSSIEPINSIAGPTTTVNPFPFCPFAPPTAPTNEALLALAQLDHVEFPEAPACSAWRRPGFTELMAVSNALSVALDSSTQLQDLSRSMMDCISQVKDREQLDAGSTIQRAITKAFLAEDRAALKHLAGELAPIHKAFDECQTAYLKARSERRSVLVKDLSTIPH